MKKTVYILSAIIAIGIAAFITFFDDISVKYAREYASKYLQTPVSIDKLQTKWFDKTVDVEGIRIANLAQFDADNAISVGTIHVAVDKNQDIMLVNDFTMDNVRLSFEQRGTNINLYQLYDNLQASSEAQQQYGSSSGGNNHRQDDTKVIIKSLNITNVSVLMDTDLFSKDIALPDINIRDIGQVENGIPAAEIPVKIMEILLDEVNKAAQDSISDTIDDTINQGKSELKKIKDSLGSQTNQLLKSIGIK